MSDSSARAQLSFFDEIIVDNFAGGGGASTGIELATGRPVTIAINHDPDAILMHKTNHPYTMHLQASVWDVDPEEVCEGRPVGLAWFSPDCKHFSKAKGAALVDRNIRGLAWIVLRWAGTVKPRVIILENVEEFQTWGPVRNGKPIKNKAGVTFRKWKQQLQDIGYEIEHRELIAADYGAPTIRKRFVLIARCDDKPIVWPERTHAPRDSEEVKTGKLKPWVSVAEIIDWTQPAYSIFETKQEIKEKYGASAVRPLAENTLRRIIRGVDKFTIKSGKPFIVECNHSGAGHIQGVNRPIGTVTAKCTAGVALPVLEAAHTFTNTCNSVGNASTAPVNTVTTAGNQILTAANLIQYHTEQTEHVRASGLKAPMPTVDASNRYGLTCANLVEYYGNGNPLNMDTPMHTATSHDKEALTAVHLQKYFGGVIGQDVNKPVPTVTGIDHNALCASHVVEFKGQDIGQPAQNPLRTITAGGGEFGVSGTVIEKYTEGVNLKFWPQVRALLNKYCGYDLKDDEVLILIIGGKPWYIADITLRMLIPRELYRAMGFPIDYKIEKDYTGKAYSKSKQVARCGNAVCPPMAEAVVKANLPEWHHREIHTMEDLESGVAI